MGQLVKHARFATLCAALVAAPGAVAQTNEAKAQGLYDEAKQLATKGNWAAACPKLLESKRLSPDMKVIYRLAECYEHVGKLAAAWRNYQEAAAAAAKAGEPVKSRAALDLAAAIEPKIGKLRATSQAPSDAELEIDGEVIARPWVDTALALDPGDHTIEVRAAGKKPFRTTVTIAAGKTTALSVPSLPLEGAPVEADSGKIPDAPPEATSHSASLTTTVGWVLVGAGIVTTGVGGYLGLRASSKYHDADEQCGPGGCNATGFEATNDARSLGNVATIVFGTGVALAAGGVVLLVLPRTDAQSTTVSFTGQGLFLRGSF